MEKQWANAQTANKPVTDITIKIKYDGDALRPSGFNVTWFEGGIYKVSGLIKN